MLKQSHPATVIKPRIVINGTRGRKTKGSDNTQFLLRTTQLFRPRKEPMKCFNNTLAGILFCHTALLSDAYAQGNSESRLNLLDLGLEELMQIQIISAPGFSSDPKDIPSAVTIINAADIRLYGWQTLADILNTLPGFSITNDYTYSYAAVRGLAVSGDWRSRMQILINGISLNENIYDSITIDTAFPINLAEIDHIEIIRGPSASVYGSNSMFGVVNIVTRSGNDIQGVELSSLQGSGRFQRQSALWGHTLGEADLMIAGSIFDADGRTLTFNELAEAGQPSTATAIDAEEGYNFTTRLLYQNWRFSLYLASREKTIPTGSFGTLFNDPNHFERDTNRLAEVGYLVKSVRSFSWDTRINYGNYKYDGQFPYDYDSDYVLNQDDSDGSWWSVESAITTKAGPNHNLITGFSYKDNYRQNLRNYDLGFSCTEDTDHSCFESITSSENISVYLQDEIQLPQNTRLTLGWRLDKTTEQNTRQSPRVGLVHTFGKWGSIKYLFTEAYRNPNPYERFYNIDGFYSNPDLKPESMASHEATWEKALTPNQQFILSYYQYELADFIFSETGKPLSNLYGFRASGTEATLAGRFPAGLVYTTSLTHQHTSDQGPLVEENVSAWLFKINLAFPTPVAGLTSAVEFRAASHRHTFLPEARIAGYGITNLIFNYHAPAMHWNIKAGLKDIFDRGYEDPVADDPLMTIPRDRITQLGRTWFAELAYKY
jgi:outer membrane cobalamin receptor